MKWMNTAVTATLFAFVSTTLHAAESYGAETGYTEYASQSLVPYEPVEIDYGETRYSKRKSRRKIRIGGLMLGIGYAVPATVGLLMLDVGDSAAVGARMLIPYFGFAEAGVRVMDETFTVGALCFVPSIVQLVGTGLLITGVSQKNKSIYHGISAAPVLYREGGGGIGVSFAL